jgi:hypothetical protein
MSTKRRRGREREGRVNVRPELAEALRYIPVDPEGHAAGPLEEGNAMATSVDPAKVADLEFKVSRIHWTGSLISIVLGTLVSVFGVMSVNAAFNVNSQLATLANDIEHLQKQTEKTEKRIDTLEVRLMDRFDALQKQLGERPPAAKAGL